MRRQPAQIEREYGPFETPAPAAHGVTFDGERVWVATGEKLVGFDPVNGEVTRTLSVSATAGTAFDGRNFFQLNGKSIQKIDAQTGAVVASLPSPFEGDCSGMTWAEGSLWIGQYKGRAIHRVDPDTGKILRTIRSDRFVTGVTFAEGDLWHGVWEEGKAEIRRIEKETGEVAEILEMPAGMGVSGLESDGGERLFAGAGPEGKVRAIRRPKRSALQSAPMRKAAAPARTVSPHSLDSVRVFVEIVRGGSFSEAARVLRMPKSTVSLRLAQLEASLGFSLLLRTTRRLSPTAAGAAYFATAARALGELDAAAEDLVAEAREPRGTLRVAMTGSGTAAFGDLVGTYLERYPDVRVELLLGDRRVDLIAEKVDVAIRFGALGDDASLVAKRLGTAYRKVVATPDYVARHPAVHHPRDLAAHRFAAFPGRGELLLVSDRKQRETIRLNARFTANAVPAVRHQVLRGVALGCLPIALVAGDLAAGTLVDVLPAWRSDLDPVNIVYPKQPVVPRRVRAFVDLASELLRPPSFMPSPAPGLSSAPAAKGAARSVRRPPG